MKKCRNCGNMIIEDSANCPYCFAVQSTNIDIISCGNCKTKSLSGNSYCRACGNKLIKNDGNPTKKF